MSFITRLCGDFDQSAQAELGTYDLITAIEIIEHVANPEALVALAAEHLAPNGWFVITTPNIYSLRLRMRFLLTGRLHSFDTNGDPTHAHPLILQPTQTILLRHGLELAQTLTYDGNGSRWFARLAERALSLALPNDLPGDNLSLFLRKR